MNITKTKNILIKKKVLGKLIEQINQGGVTYCPSLNKDYSRTKNIAISPFPERSQILIGKATKRIVTNYCNKNKDLISKNFSLGAWLDKGCLKTYLDIVAPIPLEKESEALTLGINANQIAGFNLFDFSEIPLGGTGEFNLSMITPFEERFNKALTLISN